MTLQLGEVSGILHDYLSDCWRWACDKNDLMRGAELTIEEIPRHHVLRGVRSPISNCGASRRPCPHCGSGDTYLIQGDETMIKEIAVPDEDECAKIS